MGSRDYIILFCAASVHIHVNVTQGLMSRQVFWLCSVVSRLPGQWCSRLFKNGRGYYQWLWCETMMSWRSLQQRDCSGFSP